MDHRQAELKTLERAGWDALCAGTGGDFYARVMTPDGLMVLADGSVLDRDRVAASLEQAPPWTAYSLSDLRTVPVGQDCAALVYRAAATRPEVDLEAVMTSCYVRVEGAWRLALYQQTVVPGA